MARDQMIALQKKLKSIEKERKVVTQALEEQAKEEANRIRVSLTDLWERYTNDDFRLNQGMTLHPTLRDFEFHIDKEVLATFVLYEVSENPHIFKVGILKSGEVTIHITRGRDDGSLHAYVYYDLYQDLSDTIGESVTVSTYQLRNVYKGSYPMYFGPKKLKPRKIDDTTSNVDAKST